MDSNVVYNLTFKLGSDISDDWLNNLKSTYLPECYALYKPIHTQINEILIKAEDNDLTFALQFTFPSEGAFLNEGKQMLKVLVLSMDKDFKNRYVYFGTLMQVLHTDPK
ncbi:MAG: DUF4286 family protein [Saprospiraceae bacterium]|nr:DUF4286 family protein [Saprospiraceae bacterium]